MTFVPQYHVVYHCTHIPEAFHSVHFVFTYIYATCQYTFAIVQLRCGLDQACMLSTATYQCSVNLTDRMLDMLYPSCLIQGAYRPAALRDYLLLIMLVLHTSNICYM